MRQKKFWFMLWGILVMFALALILPRQAVAASKYKVLHRFHGKDGAKPEAVLIFDAAGNLYGTTRGGGSTSASCGGSGCGTVYRLTPSSDGSWTESVLYNFCPLTNCADGSNPVASLIFDAAGNLYGTTPSGGASGDGTVFKLKPNSNGSWTESVLYSFSGGADGGVPYAVVLVFDARGNLYGTTSGGGSGSRQGVVFKLKPNSDGSWTESVLYTFCSVANCADGSKPVAGLIFDAAGNLYGTTWMGGAEGIGTVFKLTRNSDGSWAESVLHSFNDVDGNQPFAALTLDAAGNLYGTTYLGGAFSNGTVFKLKANSDGSWTESVLHSFAGHPAANPYAGVIFDEAGNLYGTTFYGRRYLGAVFKLAPNSDGSWAYSTAHAFQGKPAANPYAGVVLDSAGNLYGTTVYCGSGAKCQGVVYEITP